MRLLEFFQLHEISDQEIQKKGQMLRQFHQRHPEDAREIVIQLHGLANGDYSGSDKEQLLSMYPGWTRKDFAKLWSMLQDIPPGLQMDPPNTDEPDGYGGM
jgi:hypothetical protein